MTLPFDLNLLDLLLVALIVVFAVRGALRGLLEEVTGLIAILAGIWLAGRYYPPFGNAILHWTGSSWSNIIAYALILCGALIAVSLASRLLHSFLKLAYADWLNHLAGAAAGGFKGFVLSAVVVTLLGLFMGDAPFMRDSRMTPPIKDMVTLFKGHLPTDFFNS